MDKKRPIYLALHLIRLPLPGLVSILHRISGMLLFMALPLLLLMLQYSTYSVISPEGCASILWKSPDKKEVAAEAMGLTAHRLSELKLVDEVLSEPLGGAHRDPVAIAARIQSALLKHLDELERIPPDELRSQRNQKIASFGAYSET